MNILKKYNYQLFDIFAILIIITIPLKENYNSITIILFLLYCFYTLIVKRKQVNFKLSKEVFIFILPFVFILLQFFYSDFHVYQKNLLRSVSILLFPIFFFLMKHTQNKSNSKILSFFVLSALVYSSFLIIVAFYRQFIFSPDFSKINWYFFAYHDFTEALKVHPTYLGMYNCLAFSVLISDVIKKNKLTIIKTISTLLLVIVILLSGSRISLVSLVFVFCYLFLSNFKSINKTFRYFFLTFFIIVPVVVFTFVPIIKERMIDMTLGLKDNYAYAKYGKDVKYTGSITPRIELWKCANEVSSNNYFFGNGFGYTQEKLNKCYENKGFSNFSKLNYQTHNQYLNHLARGGVIGLLVLLITFLVPLYFAIKNKNFIYTSFLMIILICCVTENILNLHFGIVFYAFFNSLLFFVPNNQIET